MTDDYDADGFGPPVLFRHLAEDVEAILNGRPLARRDPEPTDAGIRLGAALRFHAGFHDFQVTWHRPLLQLATLTVPGPVAAWLVDLGLGADLRPAGDGWVSALMTEAECHDLADRIENAELPTASDRD